MTENMKAYQVSNGEYSCIAFGTRGQARSLGANEFGCDFTEVDVKRAKWADEYQGAENIPKEAFLKNGWWWECNCGQAQYEETAIVLNEFVYCEKCLPNRESEVKANA